MNFAKFLLVLVLGIVGYVSYLAFKPSAQPSQTVQQTITESSRESLRGDDPTYAEEVRKQAQLTQETQKKQQTLENELADAKKRLESENEKLKVELSKVTDALGRLQGEIKSAASKSVENGQNLANEQLANLSALTEALQAQIKAGEQRYEELVKKISASQAPTVDSAGETAENSKREEKEVSRSKTRDIYGTGSLIMPYGGIGHNATGDAATASEPANGVASVYSAIQSAVDEVAAATSGQTTVRNVNPDNRQLPVMQAQQKTEWPTVFPVYTLPPNTVLANSVLLTPMVGRVPIGRGNDLEDPFFFRVEVGSDNLAANGHQIPGVAKMIVSGYAVGVREQQCARGYVDSLTFIFIDGRIVTKGRAAGEGSSNRDALGYLSDPWGKPCIRGEYINNAGDYIKSRSMSAFLEAAAEGLAQGQVSYRQGSDGNYQAVLDGNVWRFVFGKGVSGSAAEIADYVRERTANAFDVVYVKQGLPVQIMLDAMVEIDYDANARKVNYYAEPKKTGRYD